MICSGEKTKLMVMGTYELRERKFREFGRKLKIKVEDKIVEESPNEKLLGIVINNNLCWSTHLYGNNVQGAEKIEGLLPQLSKRTGMLKKVAPLMKRSQLKSVIDGVFNAKLIYGIQLFCNTWGIVPMDETNRKFSAFTKDDLRRLQVLQNVTLGLQTKMNRYTPTDQLLNASDALSVHQLGALHTLNMTFKVLHSGKPSHLAEQMKLRSELENRFHGRHGKKVKVRDSDLTLSRSGFVHRGARLWNTFPENIQ